MRASGRSGRTCSAHVEHRPDDAVSARGRISAEVMEAYTNRSAGDGAAAKPGLPKVTDPFMVSFT